LRFPKGKEWATGYAYEPWHFRYVGRHAEAMKLQGWTLEEYILANFEL
jgi:D-alanyl-D-alanine carboxypeptidase